MATASSAQRAARVRSSPRQRKEATSARDCSARASAARSTGAAARSSARWSWPPDVRTDGEVRERRKVMPNWKFPKSKVDAGGRLGAGVVVAPGQ